jgi:hypothetical protein
MAQFLLSMFSYPNPQRRPFGAALAGTGRFVD